MIPTCVSWPAVTFLTLDSPASMCLFCRISKAEARWMEYLDEVYVRFEVCSHNADRRRSCEYFQMAWRGGYARFLLLTFQFLDNSFDVNSKDFRYLLRNFSSGHFSPYSAQVPDVLRSSKSEPPPRHVTASFFTSRTHFRNLLRLAVHTVSLPSMFSFRIDSGGRGWTKPT